MQQSSIVRFSIPVMLAALVTIGCSGGASNTSSTATTAPQAVTTAATTTMQGPAAAPAPIPASLTCKGAIVWVNMSKKAYHMAGDPFYGRTKNGMYMCQAAADAKGYHMAGMPRRHTGSHMMQGAAPTPAPAST